MSRYDTPTSDFGKLELDSKPKKSTSAMPPITRSTTSKRRRAASSQLSSSGTSGHYPTGSRSTGRPPTRQEASQQRSLPAQTRVDHENDGSDDSDDDNEEGEDGNAEGEDSNEGGEDSNEESEEEARELTPEQLHLRLYEILSVLTLQRLTPAELERSFRVPEDYSPHTYVTSELYTIRRVVS